MKKLLTLFLLLALMLPQLAACTTGGGTESSTDTADTTDAEQTTEEPAVDIPDNLMLKTMAGFVLKGKTLRMNLAHEDPVLDLSGRFSAEEDGAKISFSKDEAGNEPLEERKLSLSEGENVFYLKVSFRKESFVYKGIVNYRSAYTVEFYSNCKEYVPTQTVDKGSTLQRPTTPTRNGYLFLGWHLDGKLYDFSKAPTKSCTLIAHWEKLDKDSGYYTSETEGVAGLKFEDVNAGLHIVWKDYADCNGLRPNEVTCILTQTYGTTEKTYEIKLTRDWVGFADPNNTPATYSLTQGDGGAWTLSLEGLPKKVNGEACTYTLTQKPLSGNYTTLQSGSAAINTVKGYVASVDDTAWLTTRNSRFYDAAGNLIVFTGVVSANLNFGASLDNSISTAALQQMKEKGCNVLRTSIPVVGSNKYYVFKAQNSNFRTGDYSDDKGSIRATAAQKQEIIDMTCDLIDRVTAEGLYIIIDWTILTSNPNQYINEACEYFGILAAKYKNNPYVLYEICNEPASCDWSGANGIKAYAEAVIDTIRAAGSNAIVIVAPRGASNYISMSPAAYNKAGDKVGDDPIRDPLDDDRRYNVAYTQHPYAYENAYSDSTGRNSFGWRIRDAYDAGLTMICTEMSPMAAALDENDTLGFDFNQMNKYMRLFQEYDISYCYFKYYTVSSYTEWCMLKPGVNPTTEVWTREDLTNCGQWYYDLITGNGVFVEVDYDAKTVKSVRDTYKTTFSAYGLAAVSGSSFFTPFPTFAVSGSTMTNGTYYFKVSDTNSLSPELYEGYCKRIWTKISKISGNNAKQANGAAFTDASLPKELTQSMELTYTYNGKTCTLKISYGKNTDGTWGIFFKIQ